MHEADSAWRQVASSILAAASRLFQTLMAVAVLVGSLSALVWMGHRNAAPQVPEVPGGGVTVRIEVTTAWIPRALLDRARNLDADASLDGASADRLREFVADAGRQSAWYALERRQHQVDGRSASLVQVRRLAEIAEHLEEFQGVLSRAAGSGRAFGELDFSRTTLGLIPAELETREPLQAISQLVAARPPEEPR